MTELCGRLTDSYPARLNLQDQGIFQLGYYHQKQALYTKRERAEVAGASGDAHEEGGNQDGH